LQEFQQLQQLLVLKKILEFMVSSIGQEFLRKEAKLKHPLNWKTKAMYQQIMLLLFYW